MASQRKCSREYNPKMIPQAQNDNKNKNKNKNSYKTEKETKRQLKKKWKTMAWVVLNGQLQQLYSYFSVICFVQRKK